MCLHFVFKGLILLIFLLPLTSLGQKAVIDQAGEEEKQNGQLFLCVCSITEKRVSNGILLGLKGAN